MLLGILGILGEAGSGKDEAMRYLVNKKSFYSLALADPIKVYCSWMFGWDAERLYGPSKKRNEPDERYKFLRCPKCGFSAPYLTMIVRTLDRGPFEERTCPACAETAEIRDWEAPLSSRFGLQSLGDWARNLFSEAYVRFALEERINAVTESIYWDPLWAPLMALGVKKDERWMGDLDDPATHVVISDVRLPNEIEGIQKAGGKVYRIVRKSHEDTTSTGIPNHNSEIAQRSIPDEALNGIINNNGTFDELYRKLDDLIMIADMNKD